MLATTSLAESPVAIRIALGAIFVSMELSRSKWLITSLSPGGGEKMSKHTVVGGDLVGPEFGAVLCSECLFRRFDNRRQVAAFAGLAPTPWQSGQIDREQGVSKAGSPRLRKTLVELSWLWLRNQPQSALTLWFQKRVQYPRRRRVVRAGDFGGDRHGHEPLSYSWTSVGLGRAVSNSE